MAHSLESRRRSVASPGGVRVLLLELELELSEEDAVALLVGVLVPVEGGGRLETLVHHERVVQHRELVAGHVQLTHVRHHPAPLQSDSSGAHLLLLVP